MCQISLQYLYGELSTKYVKYYAFVTFLLSCPVLSCPVLSWLYFFLATQPRSNPWTDFSVVTQGSAFWGFGWRPTILSGFKTPKNPKGGVVRHFPAKLGKLYKIVISPAGNTRSIPNFDRIIEPHSWLRGWSWRTAAIAKYWKRYNSPISGPILIKLGWSHPIVSPTCPPDMFPMMRLPWRRPLFSNILQLWASRGRTRETISMKLFWYTTAR